MGDALYFSSGKGVGACTGYEPVGLLVNAHPAKSMKPSNLSFVSEVPIGSTDFTLHSVGVVSILNDKVLRRKTRQKL